MAKNFRGAAKWLPWLKPEAHRNFESVIQYVEECIPYEICVRCGGAKTRCAYCHSTGYHPQWSVEAGFNKPE